MDVFECNRIQPNGLDDINDYYEFKFTMRTQSHEGSKKFLIQYKLQICYMLRHVCVDVERRYVYTICACVVYVCVYQLHDGCNLTIPSQVGVTSGLKEDLDTTDQLALTVLEEIAAKGSMSVGA